MVEETWTTVAVPILERLALGELEDPRATTSAILLDANSNPGLHLTLVALLDDGYIEGAKAFRAMGRSEPIVQADIMRLTPKGRRAVGQWPGGESGDLLVKALEAALLRTPDPETQSKLKVLLDAARQVGTEVLSAVMTGVVKSAAGLP